MSDDSALARLAARSGILESYDDVRGQRRTTSPETRRALLAAMGFDVSTDGAASEAERALDREAWRRTLPPVVVVREPAGSVRVSVQLDAATAGPVPWRLEREDGEREAGSFDPSDLPVAERGSPEGTARVRRDWKLAARLPPGYHRIEIGEGDAAVSTPLIVAPARCFRPDSLRGSRRAWGCAVQAYALRSTRNWGSGDFTDLETLAGITAARGSGAIGLNPLHALHPEGASPYSPSSRAFLDARYLDVEAIPEFGECAEVRAACNRAEFQARLVAARRSDLVDYATVRELELPALEGLYRHFRERHLGPGSPRAEAFRRWREAQGGALRRFATYEALRAHLERDDAPRGWPRWPAPYRDAGSAAVAEFAREHVAEIEFFEWLQWQCDEQLAAVGRRCLELSMAVGLYLDLAVGVDGGGFDTWREPALFARGASIGAPPDRFSPAGQDWGLPPYVPRRLRESAYRPFVEALRTNMRHAGALRIDHVMGLMRAFWVPWGRPAVEGAYVRYPFDELLAVLALESHRQRCLVVGEDLGTVPEEVRRRMGETGILSYRLLHSLRDAAGGLAPPSAYPELALVAASTHDLPTVAGWWRGRDVAVRAELGLFRDDDARREEVVTRAAERARVLVALEREGLLPDGTSADPADHPQPSPELVGAIHGYLARTPSKLLTVQLEDVLGQLEQVNLPGTTSAYPNWRRKLTVDLEALAVDPRLEAVLGTVRRERRAATGAPVPAPLAPGVPRATYRLQLRAGFGFDEAACVVPYLARLGISHVYASPYLRARPGSPHGYDIVDHASFNPEVGSPEAFERFVDTLRAHGMGHVLDLVPNHMGVGSDNEWWTSVLEHGPASPYAEFFDIDWRPAKDELRGRVLLPTLGDHVGRVLEAGELRLLLDRAAGRLDVHYHASRFPVDPRTYPLVLGHEMERLGARLGAGDPRLAEFQSLLGAFEALPERAAGGEAGARVRLRDATVLEARLARLIGREPEIAAFVAENVALANGRVGDARSFDLLETLLEAQAWRLAYWKVAAHEINYRRFFDINDLAGLCVERPRVFAATHRFVLDLVRRGRIDGLRIDHPDGLRDPAGYFRRLRWELGETRAPGRAPAAGGPEGLWIVAEKILADGERLPADWPVHGTTGYDFAAAVGGLFVEPRARRAMTSIYTRFVGRRVDLDEVVHECKHVVLETSLAGELSVLSNLLDRISEADRATRDHTRERLRRALAEVIAALPVYRTYVTADGPSAEDRAVVERATERAASRNRTLETGIYRFVRDALALDAVRPGDEARRRAMVEFAGRFQQLSAPVMAKGVEDTAFYRYHLLLSLNEVGADPRRFGLSVPAFHRASQERAKRTPHAMLGTSTHDSKRSEDVRARISALSELPARWQEAVLRWSALNRRHKPTVEGRPAPSRNDEYALYQTLIGIWPFGSPGAAERAALRDRVSAWAVKAAREAKLHSSWVNPVPAYEDATTGFIDAILVGAGSAEFLPRLEPFARLVARLGMLNSLSQLLLKLASPGVPDVYQGEELWTFALVDPDNRRPVDFDRRRQVLEELGVAEGDDRGIAARAEGVLGDMPDGKVKLWVTWRALEARRARPEVFRDGAYRSLEADGPQRAHLVAFARQAPGGAALVVVPRLCAALCDVEAGALPIGERVWEGTRVVLPPTLAGRLRDAFTGRTLEVALDSDGAPRLEVARVLATFPVALLLR